jgi:hypothetical protein
MARYAIRERIIYDIIDTEIEEAVTSTVDPETADEVRARLERSPVDSAPDPAPLVDAGPASIT